MGGIIGRQFANNGRYWLCRHALMQYVQTLATGESVIHDLNQHAASLQISTVDKFPQRTCTPLTIDPPDQSFTRRYVEVIEWFI
jgi:hypothetical protein